MKANWKAVCLVSFAAMQLQAQSGPATRFELTAGQVIKTLEKAFAAQALQVNADQVSLPVSITTSDPTPELDVKSVEALGHLPSNHTDEISSAVKLSCHQQSTCLPFYAIITLPAGTELRYGTSKAAHASLQLAKQPAKIAIKAGTPATLVMESAVAHIQISVVSLQSGAIGQKIRASSPDHKQTYLAEVVDGTILKGSF